MGEYMTHYDYCELTMLKFRRPTALRSWNTTQTDRADRTAPVHRYTTNVEAHRTRK
jgi:hypothetical protein